MYQDPIKELEKNLEYFKDFTRYPVLFFMVLEMEIYIKFYFKIKHLKE